MMPKLGLTMTVGTKHGRSTTAFKEGKDCELWYPVISKKVHKVIMKKQAKASDGEPLLNFYPPEGHNTANSVKLHTHFDDIQSQVAIDRLINKDKSMKEAKNKKNKNKNKTKKTNMNPKFDPEMLNMKDLNQFTQQLNHLLVL